MTTYDIHTTRVRNLHGKASLCVTDSISPAVRTELERLAIFAGLTYNQANDARPADLIRIYATACSATPSDTPIVAQRMASLIDKRAGLVDTSPMPEIVVHAPEKPTIPHDTAPAFDPRVAKMLLDMQAMRDELEALKASKPTTLEIVHPNTDKPTVNIDYAHPLLGEMIEWLSLGINVFTYGPRGAGKTTMGEQISAALNCKFYASGPIKNISRLLGYVNPFTGEYHSTDFRKCFEHGGLFQIDEICASDEEVLLELNMAIANDYYAFPDGLIRKAKGENPFLLFASDNTDGTGGTDEYNGRNKLDDSFMDRFTVIKTDYDEIMEMGIAPNKEWAAHVQKFRAIAMREGIRFPSPRATLFGGNWINAGKSWKIAEDRLLYRAMEETEENRMRSLMGEY